MADKIVLRLSCGHEVKFDSRPNPRKAWPDPQLCPVHNRKTYVVEVHSKTPSVSNTTSPLNEWRMKPKRKRRVKK